MWRTSSQVVISLSNHYILSKSQHPSFQKFSQEYLEDNEGKSSGILHFTDGRPGAMSPVMDNQPGEALPLTKRESMLFYHSVVSTKCESFTLLQSLISCMPYMLWSSLPWIVGIAESVRHRTNVCEWPANASQAVLKAVTLCQHVNISLIAHFLTSISLWTKTKQMIE